MYTPKYFSAQEFKRCTPSCSIEDMDEEFLRKIDEVREKAGIPMYMLSAYRSPQWEVGKGRSGKGDHPQGCGVDFRCLTGAERYKILRAAFEVGFRRIGIAKTYIHLGTGENLPQDVVWHYYGD